MNEVTGRFESFDGAALFYRMWEDENTPWNGRVIFLLHRGHEHSQRLEGIASQKVFAGYKVFSYDNRGHGYTEERASFSFMNLVRDLDAFATFVTAKEGIVHKDIFVIANSVAGVVTATWVHDYAPDIRGMALIAPAFRIKLYFPFAKAFLKAALRFKPDLNIKSYVKSKFLTHNVEEQKRYDTDALITPDIPAAQLTTLLDTGERVVADAGMIRTPTLVVSAGKDYVVDSKIQGDFYANLSSDTKKFVAMENFYHGVLYEIGHEKVIEEIGAFMERCFTTEVSESIDDMVKLAQKEYDKIAHGSVSWYKVFNYTIQRLSMRYLGWLSRGMQIGMKYGFDSGVTLDHVYKNRPEGVTFLGRLIDKGYLESIGWRGIRKRKAHMIAAVEEKIEALLAEGKEVSILDIAGGPARYLIEIAQQYPQVKVRVRDYQMQNVEEGRTLAKERGLENIIYEQCDAFNPSNYDRKTLAPNIVIISGVFELFSDNALIVKAIEGVASVIAEEGYLLYTGQPWHPQLEQIAHVLRGHQGSAWIMRRRSTYELDRLFGSYGFEKEGMQIDEWGIFTVSSAKKAKSIL